ncbi:MAG: FAD-dependent thymidylate synthase [Pyrodictiaceae archaeon]
MKPPVVVKLVSYTRDAPRLVAAAARITVSKKTIEKAWEMTSREVWEWIRELVARGHGSPLEHATYTFEAECSRVCSHQLVRHRLASYTQQSMRYTEGFMRKAVMAIAGLLGEKAPAKPRTRQDYEKYAQILRRAGEQLEPARLADPLSEAFVYNPYWSRKTMEKATRTYLEALAAYYELLSMGIPKEDARFLIPHAARTRIVFTMNARELLESFLPLRMCLHAQWEIRALAWATRQILAKIHPEIFAWAGPRCILQENRGRRQPCKLEEYLESKCTFTIERCPEKLPREKIRQCIEAAKKLAEKTLQG